MLHVGYGQLWTVMAGYGQYWLFASDAIDYLICVLFASLMTKYVKPLTKPVNP